MDADEQEDSVGLLAYEDCVLYAEEEEELVGKVGFASGMSITATKGMIAGA